MTSYGGTVIHNVPLEPTDLPAHPGLEDVSPTGPSTRPPLTKFIRDTIFEGNDFMESITWSGALKGKVSAPSTAHVEMGKRNVNVTHGPDKVAFEGSMLPSRQVHPPTGTQHWYGRKSFHENAAKEGTASFEELDASLRQDHSPKEADYTPDVFHCVTILDYADQLAGVNFGGGVQKADLKVYEMAHNLGPMMSPRVFAVAVVSGLMEGGKKFVVVQLPVDLSGHDGAMYSNHRNVKEGDSKLKKKKCVRGSYASIERGVNLGDKTEWTMITSSDAGGNLPKRLQDMVAPGKVVHDVGLVMKWIHEKREGAPAEQ